jgi:hypothetical protein
LEGGKAALLRTPLLLRGACDALELGFAILGSMVILDQFRMVVLNVTSSDGLVGALLGRELSVALYSGLLATTAILASGGAPLAVVRTDVAVPLLVLCLIASLVLVVVALVAAEDAMYPCVAPGWY